MVSDVTLEKSLPFIKGVHEIVVLGGNHRHTQHKAAETL